MIALEGRLKTILNFLIWPSGAISRNLVAI